jgi:acid phosphatase type 7
MFIRKTGSFGLGTIFIVALLALSLTGYSQHNSTPVTKISTDGSLVAVQSWLVAGPFPSEELTDAQSEGPFRAGYSTDFLASIGGETGARINPGTKVASPQGEQFAFERRDWDDLYTDLVDVFGRLEYACAYLYAEVESEVAQDLYLHVGTNDAGKVWLGGKLVVEHPGDRGAARCQNVAVVRVEAGRTPLLLKIDQAGGGWGAYVEFCDSTTHLDYVKSSFPKVFDMAADNELPRIGDSLSVWVRNFSSWTELDVPIDWQVVDGDRTTVLEGNMSEATFVVPDGPTRMLSVEARATHPTGGEVMGRKSIFTSATGSDFFSPTTRPDHVIISLGDDAATERRIAWRTDEGTVGSVVEYVETGATNVSDVDWNAPTTMQNEGSGSAEESNLGAYHAHEAELSDLTPGKSYAYRVGDGSLSGWSRTHITTIEDGSRDTLVFAVHGDTRSDYEMWRRVMTATSATDPDFIVNVGDIVADGREMGDWNRWFYEAKDLLPVYPYMTVLGNHERQAREYFTSLALPTNAEPDSMDEQWYSFDHGPTHWVALNSCVAVKQQREWLERDLAANTKPWVFVYYHHPLYAGHVSRGDGNAALREEWGDLFDQYDVAIAWQGHDHYYFRTKSIEDNEVVEDGQGTIYLTAGGGGAGIYDPMKNRWSAVLEKSHHYVQVSISGNTLTAKAYRVDGSLLDEFTIAR